MQYHSGRRQNFCERRRKPRNQLSACAICVQMLKWSAHPWSPQRSMRRRDASHVTTDHIVVWLHEATASRRPGETPAFLALAGKNLAALSFRVENHCRRRHRHRRRRRQAVCIVCSGGCRMDFPDCVSQRHVARVTRRNARHALFRGFTGRLQLHNVSTQSLENTQTSGQNKRHIHSSFVH